MFSAAGSPNLGETKGVEETRVVDKTFPFWIFGYGGGAPVVAGGALQRICTLIPFATLVLSWQ